MKKLFFILCFIISGVFLYSQTPTSSLSKKDIRYGEEIVLRLEFKGNKSDKVIFPSLKDSLSYHLEILSSKRDTLIQNQKYTYTDSITFSAYEKGTFTLPSQKIIVNSKEYFTPQYKITIHPIETDTIKHPLYDIKPIITEPKTLKDYAEQYWVYIIMFLVLLVVIIILIVLYYLEHKKKNKNGKSNYAPDVTAINKINKLEKTNYLDNGLSKKYYSELVFILKEYMETRWGIPASKLLSDDLIEYLTEKDKITTKEQQDLTIIFHSADLAKFAKSRPSIAETKVHTEMAKGFINETKTEFLNLREPNEY